MEYKIIPDPLECPGWFGIEMNGQVLKDKNGNYRRWRSEKAAEKAAQKIVTDKE